MNKILTTAGIMAVVFLGGVFVPVYAETKTAGPFEPLWNAITELRTLVIPFSGFASMPDKSLLFNDQGNLGRIPLSYYLDGDFVTLKPDEGRLMRFVSDVGFKADLETDEGIGVDFGLEKHVAHLTWQNGEAAGGLQFTNTNSIPETAVLFGTGGIRFRSDSGQYTFTKEGLGPTTTVNLGGQVCFNTKNTDGHDVSFFIKGTSIIVEENPCRQ